MSLLDKIKSLFDEPPDPPACVNCHYFYHKRNSLQVKVNPPKGWCTRKTHFDPVEGEYKTYYIDVIKERSTGWCGIWGKHFTPIE